MPVPEEQDEEFHKGDPKVATTTPVVGSQTKMCQTKIVGGVVGLVDYLGNNLMGQVDEANLQ